MFFETRLKNSIRSFKTVLVSRLDEVPVARFGEFGPSTSAPARTFLPCVGHMLYAKKRSSRSLWAAVLVVVTCSGFPVFAQNSTEDVHIQPRPQPIPKASEVESSLRSHSKPLSVNVDMVLVPVTITDPMNRLVTGLDRENFNLFEGKEQQEIKTFTSEDAPISLGVIFDMSGSMSSKIDRAREAVIEFFKTANPQDEFFMVTFADKPEEISDFTTSVEDIQGKLVYTVPKGRTALLDAIYLGVSKMRQARYPKKALLIISDGGDNHSRYTEGEIRSTVKEADILIYAIGIYDHYFPTDEERLGPTSAQRYHGTDWRAGVYHR